MGKIEHEVWIDAAPERIYELLRSAEGISTWWDQQTKVDTSEGVVFEHSPGPEHGVVQFLVLESQPALIRWKCISKHPPDVPASEWTGTEIQFHIGSRSTSVPATQKWAAEFPIQTVLKLKHLGWQEGAKFLPFCNFAWAAVLTNLTKRAVGGDA
ncbi:hypothetical protein [Marinicella litoralis]|uniref:Activator of Hsp90 ATPase-like protein n=1 Tax=Marinicella litoralis TaxID=644220 RepID=A0A4R6XRE6_9GAMM|nr:hypothetical protein [Marinicella litoralis]TDR20467.1 hypothetical protein C8D91_1440 [Marinicella litoralis]